MRNKNFSGQGTIEYLVIMAIVIVIGLIVVSVLVSINDSGEIVSKNEKLKNMIGSSGISITEAVSDSSGYSLLNLKNNSGETLTITKIETNGNELEFNDDLISGNNNLIDVSGLCTCGTEEVSKTCEFSFHLTSQNGLEKTITQAITIDCQEDINSNVPIILPEEIVLDAIGLSGEVTIYSFDFDSSNNLYFVGDFKGDVNFGNIGLSNPNSYRNSFIAKMDSARNWVFAQRLYGSDLELNNNHLYSIKIASDDSIYVSGQYSKDINLGEFYLSNSKEYNSDSFIAELNSDGDWIWVNELSSSEGSTYISNIGLDNLDNIYLSGIYRGIISFDETFSLSPSESNVNGDVFITKLNPNGIYQWVNNAGVSYNPNDFAGFIDSIISVGENYSYLAIGIMGDGNFFFDDFIIENEDSLKDNMVVGKINNNNGSFEWINFVSSPDNSIWPYDLTINSDEDEILIGGTIFYYGSGSGDLVTFDDDLNIYCEYNCGFIGKINSNNEWIWARENTVENDDFSTINSVLFDNSNKIYAGAGPEANLIKLDNSGNIISLISGGNQYSSIYEFKFFDGNPLVAGGTNGGIFGNSTLEEGSFIWFVDLEELN